VDGATSPWFLRMRLAIVDNLLGEQG